MSATLNEHDTQGYGISAETIARKRLAYRVGNGKISSPETGRVARTDANPGALGWSPKLDISDGDVTCEQPPRLRYAQPPLLFQEGKFCLTRIANFAFRRAFCRSQAIYEIIQRHAPPCYIPRRLSTALTRL